MDIRVLRYCEAVARLGNITRAAAELHVAQPALSVAIRKLEEELGVTLFTRTRNRPVSLTPEGELLMRRAARLFHEYDSARRELADAIGLRTGTVRVGMPPMYGIGYFPSLMKAFHAAHPGITVTALEGSAGEIKGLLEDGKVDLAILEERRVQKGWAHATLDEEEVVLCVRADHPLAKQTQVADRDLDDLPMILFEGSFLQRNVLEQRCQKAGVKFRMVMQSNYVPMVHQAVVDGLGAATLLRSIVTADERLAALSFEPRERFRFDLCWLDEHYLSKANEAFMNFAIAHRRSTAAAVVQES
ncbi:LysR family transcriptional regulator [Burkholderia sp. L27(2015)]|uniref:LysR family transcriptional regulator n=1 Tax=Burkholderia sp. L27(2015) TaxID=1641858 RepID=UPI00131ACC93|nr:LysR family transcriptional regulator [Burkholderia sp. L27(2015)]